MVFAIKTKLASENSFGGRRSDGFDEFGRDWTEFLLGSFFQRLVAGEFGIQNEGIGKFDFHSFFAGESAPPQTDYVESRELIDFVNNAIGRDVTGHATVPLGHRKISHVDELVNGGATSEEDLVSDANVPGDHDIIGEDVVVPNADVVCEMGNGHEKITISNNGIATCFSATIDGNVFAEGVVVADDNSRYRRRIEREVLRVATDDGTVIDDVVLPHRNAATNLGLRADAASGTYCHSVLDDGEGTHFDVTGDGGGG